MVRNHWVRALVFGLVMIGLMVYPRATTSAHSPAAASASPRAAFSLGDAPMAAALHPTTSGAAAVELDALPHKIPHYHYGVVTGHHEVSILWYLQAVKFVGWDPKDLDELYDFCAEERNHDHEWCKALSGL
jgi:hypothetical protein